MVACVHSQQGTYSMYVFFCTVAFHYVHYYMFFICYFMCEILYKNCSQGTLPCQQDDHDCGVMVCQYAKHLVFNEHIKEVYRYCWRITIQ